MKSQILINLEKKRKVTKCFPAATTLTPKQRYRKLCVVRLSTRPRLILSSHEWIRFGVGLDKVG